MLYIILYILAILAANLTADAILTVGVLQFALGTLFFGVIFTLRDLIHRQYNKAVVYATILAAVGVNILAAAASLASARIILASAIALLLSELTDTEVYHALRHRVWVIRVLSSNALSAPLDTMLFTMLAFYGVWSNDLIASVIIGDSLVKYAIAACAVGLGVNIPPSARRVV
ncbi:MAG: VUT family protein [Roseiflexus sp.]|nr:VUT family protein [Roseiflexus sp.]MCS7290689.1 VUT family protein [Roseiflexus sp.]MDW8145427.1 VUT family protein [Roseiflexaceae bacterium]MDW8232235.1 VUT family protein [Roseiflexaceae bacterium]